MTKGSPVMWCPWSSSMQVFSWHVSQTFVFLTLFVAFSYVSINLITAQLPREKTSRNHTNHHVHLSSASHYLSPHTLKGFKPSFIFLSFLLADCTERRHGTGVLTSPGSPGPYFENAKCSFRLSVDEGFQLTLRFIGVFDVESRDGKCVDFVKVRVTGRR